jgi:hypothetical protein
MVVSATLLANDSKAIIDRVLSRRENADVHRHGKTVVQIRRKIGVDAKDLVERLKQARFTTAEQRELKTAMDAANEVFCHAHRD